MVLRSDCVIVRPCKRAHAGDGVVLQWTRIACRLVLGGVSGTSQSPCGHRRLSRRSCAYVDVLNPRRVDGL
eukprot:2107717-Pyramimonas_sp.AAC.1